MGLNTTSAQNVLCGFQIAQQAREKRGDASAKAQPLTQAQQQSIERDAVLDEKLDVIKQVVIQLGQIATDINEELHRQDKMLDEVEVRNKQMKKILEQPGGRKGGVR